MGQTILDLNHDRFPGVVGGLLIRASRCLDELVPDMYGFDRFAMEMAGRKAGMKGWKGLEE